MYEIYSVELSLVSRILLSRLSRPSTVDIGIILPDVFNANGREFDRSLTRFTGCFNTDSAGLPCFYLVAKSDPEKDIDYLFVYYFNRNHKTLQQADKDLLKRYVPNICDPTSGLKIGIINILCSCPQVTFLSTMMEGIDFTIGSKLLSDFKTFQRIRLNVSRLPIGPLPNCKLDHCDGRPSRDVIDQFEAVVTEAGKRFYLADARSNLKDPDAVWIRDNGHLIGSFYCKESHVVNYLVTHRNQFLDDQTYDRIKEMTRRWYSNGSDLTFVVTRFYANALRRCDDPIIQTAWRIIMYMQPHVMITIQENELHYIDGNFDEMSEWISEQKRYRDGQASQSQSQLLRLAPAISATVEDPSEVQPVEVLMSSQSRFQDVVHPDNFYVYDYEALWNNDIATMREVSRERRRIKDSIVPPIHEIQPFTDLAQLYLKTMPCYYDGIKLMGQIWNMYAATVTFGKLLVQYDRDSDITGAHFVIGPMESSKWEDCIVVIDQVRQDWIFLNPDNEAYHDPKYFDELVKPSVLSLFPEIVGFTGWPVLMSSTIQVEYPRLHLMMSLYVISRIFQYCKQLPKKIIYGDWELRKYAHDICVELQLTNAFYNKVNGLVDENGWLIEGAYESLPSPLRLQNFVVPKDQCMICKKRYFKNLGRHMASDHNEQAALASRARLEFD